MIAPLALAKAGNKRLDWLQRELNNERQRSADKPPSHNHTKSQFKATHAHTAKPHYANC